MTEFDVIVIEPCELSDPDAEPLVEPESAAELVRLTETVTGGDESRVTASVTTQVAVPVKTWPEVRDFENVVAATAGSVAVKPGVVHA